jgi:hypothetical protein
MTWLMSPDDMQWPECDTCGTEGPSAPLGPDPDCMAHAMAACEAAGWSFPIVGRAQVDTCRACSVGIPMGQLELSSERKCA